MAEAHQDIAFCTVLFFVNLAYMYIILWEITCAIGVGRFRFSHHNYYMLYLTHMIKDNTVIFFTNPCTLTERGSGMILLIVYQYAKPQVHVYFNFCCFSSIFHTTSSTYMQIEYEGACVSDNQRDVFPIILPSVSDYAEEKLQCPIIHSQSFIKLNCSIIYCNLYVYFSRFS